MMMSGPGGTATEVCGNSPKSRNLNPRGARDPGPLRPHHFERKPCNNPKVRLAKAMNPAGREYGDPSYYFTSASAWPS